MHRIQNRLLRLQLLGMLGTVVTVVTLLAGYFFYQHWQDFQLSRAANQRQSELRGQAFLRAWGEHARMQLEALHSQSSDTLQQRIREQVDTAATLANALYQRQKSTRLPEHIQRDIIESLRPLRYFEGRGYFFVDGMDGRCLLLPTSPEREGNSLLSNRDDQGTYIMQALIKAAASPPGSGFVHYRWARPGERSMSDKIAYVRYFAPYHWLIGGGEYLRDSEEDMQQQGLAMLRKQQVAQHSGIAVYDTQGRTLLSFDNRHNRQEGGGVLQALALSNPPGSVFSFEQQEGEQRATYTAYVTTMPQWHWRVVAVARHDTLTSGNDDDNRLLETTRNRVLATSGILAGTLLLALLFSWHYARWMHQLVDRFRLQLSEKERLLEANARDLELTRHMSDSAADIIALRDSNGRVVYLNQRARECFAGEHSPELQQLFAGPLDEDTPQELGITTLQGPQVLEVQRTRVCFGGEQFDCITARDVSARVAQQHELRLAAKVFEASTEAILITDARSRILAVNRAFSTITGYTEAEALGHSPALLASGRHDAQFYEAMWSHLRARGQWAGEIWNRRKSGEVYPEWLTISALRDESGALTHYVALFSDISERKEAEARVQHLAEYDYLTDLPNRLLLTDRLQQALRLAHRGDGKVAVLFMDLDRFKNINDSLGHATGDALLQAVARRTHGELRDMDTVGRTGGDEFVIILPELSDSAQAASVAERILEALQAPFSLDGHQLVVSASIGIAISPDDGSNAALLLKNADMAMYEAKAAGRNNFHFFNRHMTRQANERLQLEGRLRAALAGGEFHLAMQPKVHMANRRLTGFEALLRWTDSAGQSIPPTRFIPVAEDSGLIVEIGLWVLRESCRVAAAWPRGATPFTVAVNASPRQLAQPGFAGEVARALADSGLPAAQLEIEVTENALLQKTGVVQQTLAQLKALGVRLAVDDFGTGYSSLAYLKNFAPDTVKIDRCFVTNLEARHDNAAIVLAIITLAKSLGMEALAEGVETEAEFTALATLGCDTVQGYLTGKPLPLDEAAALVAAEVERAE
ncbi:EAL domain-containing protein [Vogesella sp. LIG4]|uniref:bifunctional diguanylate cyclase/phosphodiesterase n=1 Tax=Vogesella sp. LIG4 TaxID=1192162 RepID=UPI0008200AE8|nr:EAL domain-containing protein [Vogesella sp. LIG4]SCK11545.1 PAS domain S-box-containing protein/diguanylate cyclase (GGDEF) domain-containing protein [Vogesella sp. LIG4]